MKGQPSARSAIFFEKMIILQITLRLQYVKPAIVIALNFFLRKLQNFQDFC